MSSLSPSASWMTTTPGQGGRVAGSAAYARTRPGTASKVTSGIGGAYVTRWGEEDAVVGGALDGRAASSPPRKARTPSWAGPSTGGRRHRRLEKEDAAPPGSWRGGDEERNRSAHHTAGGGSWSSTSWGRRW